MKIFKKTEVFTNTVGNKNEIDEIMHIILVIQRMFGQHILDPRWTVKRFFLYQLGTTLLFVYVAFGTYEILKETSDVKLIAEACYTFVVITVSFNKYFLIAHKVPGLRKLYVELKSTLYDIIKNDSIEKFKRIQENAKKLVYLLFLFMFVPILTYLIRVFWYYSKGVLVTMSRTTSTLMPMRSPYFELGLILHSVFMFGAAFNIMQIDMFFVLYMFCFGIACDITTKNLGLEKRGENEDELAYATRLNDKLRELYKVHVKLVEFLNTLNEAYKWLTLIPQLGVGVCICLILLLMSKGVDWSFTLNVVPTIAELFTFSWFGEHVKNKVSDWRNALHNYDWTSMRAKDKKSYYIMVSYMNKEFGIQPAIGKELALVTMSYVLKFSYQVYTVLQTMDA